MTLPVLAGALGLGLLHSLWEGAAAALFLALALSVLRPARARYAVACLALVSLLGAFVFSVALQLPRSAGPAPFAGPVPNPLLPEAASPFAARPENIRLAPYLAAIWGAGVVLFHLRTLAGWLAARQLRRRGVCIAPAPWQRRLNALAARIQLHRGATLLESSLAAVPMVAGYLRPAILVPVGLLASMPAAHIEAILLHELAHIHRRDYLVNLLQTVAENFLFYHPAAWWISLVIRREREHCCDDLVVAVLGDRVVYATALSVLETNRHPADAVLAATGGNLMNRIARILSPREARQSAPAPVVLAGILTLAAAALLSAWQTQPSGPYAKWLNEDVVYIIQPPERAAFLNLTTAGEREQFIAEFWLRRDPTPGTVENEMKNEHYRRLGYANALFASPHQTGWKTDRGRMYIQFGPPDEIESHPSGGSTGVPYEEWLYHLIPGVGTQVIMRFEDQAGAGDYRMTMDPHPPKP